MNPPETETDPQARIRKTMESVNNEIKALEIPLNELTSRGYTAYIEFSPLEIVVNSNGAVYEFQPFDLLGVLRFMNEIMPPKYRPFALNMPEWMHQPECRPIKWVKVLYVMKRITYFRYVRFDIRIRVFDKVKYSLIYTIDFTENPGELVEFVKSVRSTAE